MYFKHPIFLMYLKFSEIIIVIPTVTVNVQESNAFPFVDAVHVTVVVSPMSNMSPDDGLQDTSMGGSASGTIGLDHMTEFNDVIRSAGQAMDTPVHEVVIS